MTAMDYLVCTFAVLTIAVVASFAHRDMEFHISIFLLAGSVGFAVMIWQGALPMEFALLSVLMLGAILFVGGD